MYINQRYHSYIYELNNETLKLRKDINLEKIRKTVEENANGDQKETTTLTIKHILIYERITFLIE